MKADKFLMIRFLVTVMLVLTVVACGGEEVIYDEKQDDYVSHVDYDTFCMELQELENKILSQPAPDENLLKEATTKFQDFAGYFPTDPKAPEYLLKASDFALALGQIEKSIKILDRIITEYPDYNRMEDVMYNKADHLDFNMRDTTAAKIAYQEFIDKFPNSELVDDAQSRIENIALSLEELAEKFSKQLEEKPQ